MNFDKRSFILAASLVLASGAAFAQAPSTETPAEQQRQGKRDHRGGQGRIAAALNLTDTQKEQAKAIHEKYKASNTEVRTQMRDLRSRAEAAKQANNTAELDRIKQEREAVFAKAKESWNAERTEIRSILTPEQQTKFDEMAERRGKRGRG
ncbi:MAG TPA: Spy/CpxP family protein refolding chaperone [Bryobacteraceae bacterium]|nr:Spy/CpxP family protein refolding chaperone [Bryobacteraceae bacterium]